MRTNVRIEKMRLPALTATPTRTELAAGLTISEITTGLWQMADQERDGATLDLDLAARELHDYAEAGFDTFDMADHYGNAEIVAGKARRLLIESGRPAPVIMTKWCPAPGRMDRETVLAGVVTALKRLNVETVDLMQLHWWRYEYPQYLDALEHLMRLREYGLIRHIGLTNFDAAHLHLVAANGIEIASNQVCFSLLDRRAAGDLGTVCAQHGIRLLAFGTLAGGFLSDRWLGQPEPGDVQDWSKMKYKRFIESAGGWAAFQGILAAASKVAQKHGASIANVATRWVLDHQCVATVIVGARLGERQHREDNLRLMSLRLDDEDRALIDAALQQTAPIPGDCGDEYRKPPFLTASGDLSHHLASQPKYYRAAPVPARPQRSRVDSGSVWEAEAGFSRAVRIGKRILVSGTTATDANGNCVCPGDAGGQTSYILDKIAASLEALGGTIDDVVRTRIYMDDKDKWQDAAKSHRRAFAGALPANTLIEVAGLVGPYEVEIEAEAVAENEPAD